MFVITALSLENWKSHSKSRFDFASGTNILLGRMGSGKSSVLDALCFALYGTFPKMSRRDQTVENLVNMGSGADYAEVSAEFTRGDKKYSVMRRIGRGISEAEVREEGRLVQKGPKQVTEHVCGVLGVDYELFTRAIYSEQNRMDYLLSLNPRSRKSEIDWLLGLGQFDAVREEAGKAALRLTEQSGLLSSEADLQKITSVEAKMGELKTQLLKRKSALEENARESEETKGKLKGKEGEFSILSKKREAFQKETSICERERGAIERLSKEAEGKTKPEQEEVAEASAMKGEAEKRLLTLKTAARQAQNELSAIKSELAVCENRLSLAKTRAERKAKLTARITEICAGKGVAELRAALEAKKTDLLLKVSLRDRALSENAELEKAVRTLLEGRGKCPVCDSDLSGGKAHEIGKEKRERIAKNKASHEQRSLEVSAIQREITVLEKAVSEVELCRRETASIDADGTDEGKLAGQASSLSARRTLKASENEKLEADIAAVEKESVALRERATEIQNTAKLFFDLEAAKEKLASSEKSLAALDFDEKKFEALRWECNALRVELAKMQAEGAGEEKQVKLLEEMVTLELNGIATMKQKALMASKYSQAAEGMVLYKNALSTAQSELRTHLVSEINQALCEIWPAIYPYGDYNGVKIEADEKDYRLLMRKGEWLEVDSVASGGERACLCLALRIAFATVLTPDIGWLILDEPTHNLDSEAVGMLSTAISEKIPSIVEQTFVITHDSALGEGVSGNVFRLERDKSKNESTRLGAR